MTLRHLLPLFAVLLPACEGSIFAGRSEANPSADPPAPNAPALDGAQLYAANCAGCHKPLEVSVKAGATPARIHFALAEQVDMAFLRGSLSDADVEALAAALALSASHLPVCDQPLEIGHTELLRLSNIEYDNTLRDLFGIAGRPSVDHHFAQDNAYQKFTNIEGVNRVQSTQLEAYLDTAYDVADEVLSHHELWVQFFPDACWLPGAADCLPAALDKLLSRGLRRPASTADVARYVALNGRLRSDGLAQDVAWRWTFAAAVSSPQFLYKSIEHPEPGNPQRVAPLDGYDLATRLSYFLWQSLPDAELTAAAARGELATDEQLAAQVRRMLRDPRASALVDTFMAQWFELNHLDDTVPDPALFPQFTDAIRSGMKTEARLFFLDLVQNDRSFYDLLQGNSSFLDQGLAQYYGLPPVTGGAFLQVDLSGSPREKAGLFGLGSFLTMTSRPDETSVIRRGRWVLDNLQCKLPVKPSGVTQNTTGLTPAQASNQRRSDPQCSSCHDQMDPVGFALEQFSPVGQHRTRYADGTPVDTSGVLPGGQHVSSPQELGQALGTDDHFRSCMAEKLLVFSLNRKLADADACTVNQLGLGNVSPDQPFSKLVIAVVKSPLFTQQRGL